MAAFNAHEIAFHLHHMRAAEDHANWLAHFIMWERAMKVAWKS